MPKFEACSRIVIRKCLDFTRHFSVVCVLVLQCNHCAGERLTTEKCMENSNCDQIYVRHIRSLHIWCNLNNDRFLYLPARICTIFSHSNLSAFVQKTRRLLSR